MYRFHRFASAAHILVVGVLAVLLVVAGSGSSGPAYAVSENTTSAPRHTTYDLSSFAGHSAQAVLDQSRLNLSVTDLSIASFGPEAALTRSYSSDRTVLT